ncbi:Argininosuccinate lyase [Candidatus Magnetaquicoccaceae bacterium FCR-1]|uniref:Argininosuccinate lyase n=1 Tax=Candidatus Magnetaquiglobus chichijimensis TaxID=3141448 RepID=A0ABQ0CC68_9PROT
MSKSKPWGGRFSQPTDAFMESFSASIHYDSRLFRQDIQGSMTHCRMLARQGIIAESEADLIVEGLARVKVEIEEGRLPFRDDQEDIHMHVEDRLRELIGPVAGKLHTARSRNDQVATDLRLWLREEVDAIREALRSLQRILLTLAETHVETVMPGFTHLQNAQPVSFGHHLMAYFEMFDRDRQRFGEARKRINQLPLGSAALAGTPFPIDRAWVAKELGFEGICRNSLDAVSDRDFVIETAAACSLVMMHLSRFSEELILWSSPAFGFVELSDAFATGSSIMPQKKNPDAPELVRGKSGRVTGHLMGLLTMMKGLPLAYNRDMQEDKEAIFDIIETVRGCLKVFAGMLAEIRVHQKAMAAAAKVGFTTATDLADYLVRQGIPFRKAHEVSGRLVRLCVESGRTLEQLSLAEMQAADPRIGADVVEVLTVTASINARKVVGGTAFATVRAAIEAARSQVV